MLDPWLFDYYYDDRDCKHAILKSKNIMAVATPSAHHFLFSLLWANVNLMMHSDKGGLILFLQKHVKTQLNLIIITVNFYINQSTINVTSNNVLCW